LYGKEPPKSATLKGQNKISTGGKNLRISPIVEHERARGHLKAIEIKKKCQKQHCRGGKL
jgi:hypothetical protein